jgi:hypothetical protein
MDKELQTAFMTMSPAFLRWLETRRNKNPLKGSNGGANQNSVFVEIGKNLIVDEILEMRQHAINPPKAPTDVKHGSEIMGNTIV